MTFTILAAPPPWSNYSAATMTRVSRAQGDDRLIEVGLWVGLAFFVAVSLYALVLG